MERPSVPIPVVISVLPAGSTSQADVPLTTQFTVCSAEAQDHGSIVDLPSRERDLHLATLDAAELETIRAWLQENREQFQLLVDLHALHRHPRAVVALEDILAQARFRVVSVTLWALAPLWVADDIRESVDAGPLPCSPAARMGERTHLGQQDTLTSPEDLSDGTRSRPGDEIAAGFTISAQE